jgi:hypothetical protein
MAAIAGTAISNCARGYFDATPATDKSLHTEQLPLGKHEGDAWPKSRSIKSRFTMRRRTISCNRSGWRRPKEFGSWAAWRSGPRLRSTKRTCSRASPGRLLDTNHNLWWARRCRQNQSDRDCLESLPLPLQLLIAVLRLKADARHNAQSQTAAPVCGDRADCNAGDKDSQMLPPARARKVVWRNFAERGAPISHSLLPSCMAYLSAMSR